MFKILEPEVFSYLNPFGEGEALSKFSIKRK